MTKKQMIDGLHLSLKLLHNDAQNQIDNAENDEEGEQINNTYTDAEYFIHRAIAYFTGYPGDTV